MNDLDKVIKLIKKLTELVQELSKLVWEIGSVIAIILYIISQMKN